MADGTLFPIPKEQATEQIIPSLLALSDVMCTGHHAAVSAGVNPNATVAIVGDGAVGLCAVLASKRLGAKKIILLSTHEDRSMVGKKFGATDIVAKRGQEAIEEVKSLTGDLGADCVLECVGNRQSWETVFGITRAGGNIGFVGVPQGVPDIPVRQLFEMNVGVKGGLAPAGSYITELMPDVLTGNLDCSAIFTKTLSLDEIAEGYKAMDQRREIKVLLKP